ncbi:MAG: NADH-quinone oxidoreductase subunit NuoF, partial [Chloroflexi bacterium]|nr:NADH-quinone oxidoreductase subunit NuoF [Chloroflexota bacterium]
MRIRALKDLQEAKRRGLKGLYPDVTKITVGLATCGVATGAREVYKALAQEAERQGLEAALAKTGCLGLCQKEPLVDVLVPGKPRVLYAEMTPAKATELVAELAQGRFRGDLALAKMAREEYVLEDLWHAYPLDGEAPELEAVPFYQDLPFYARQRKIVLRNCGFIDPEDIEQYIARGGYFPLYKVLTEMKPEEVIEVITKSGLRGRGGAGFPTGVKWRATRQAKGETRYVICNADEGDPGAYMDRSILEGDPHSVIEGMIIGAYAIGAREGYVYVRNEYPLAIKSLTCALAQAEEYGLLGRDILGSGFDLSIKISRGAGAFVCGEETALIASIEGRPGEPRPRPPYPAEVGLWGQPTNINNVKTWVNVPAIIARGPDWFAGIGTAKSKGTMVFSLVGKINNTGLAEVPMGVPLKQLVFDIGGGVPQGKAFKAVQTGGPSGGCIPASLLDLQVDYEQLTQAGSIMGSGGMVVMDEDTCMVDVARFFLTFTKDESCGKCTPCREGTKRMLEILTDIAEGRGEEGHIALLEELASTVKDTSLCALGGTAPNPVLTTLRYFRDEYEQHIRYKRCPAMVCKKIIFAPCKYNCPVRTDVPTFIAHIARGQYREAFEVIRAVNPFPIACGYICHHPCEDRCRSLETGGEALSIKGLKRFAGDYAMRAGIKPLARPRMPGRERVAVVGSGPAGLAAAYDLANLGYEITVFEAGPIMGGNLAWAIPEFRLPRRIMEAEIENIKRAGVKIQTNTAVGQGLTLDDLFARGYKAILLAVGAHKSLKLNIPGEGTAGVIDALEFLKMAKLGKAVPLGERVAVIGGGNAAIDAARTALRVGGKKISILYRRTRAEMPAMKREIEAGVEEGVEIRELVSPTRILSRDSRLASLECVSMELGEFDETGRRRPMPIPYSEFIMPLDSLIVAVGEEPDLSFLPRNHGLGISRRNTIIVDPETLVTGRPGIFAAGDAVTGPSTIADSIASGKLAAVSIHKYLRGQPLAREYTVTGPSPHVEPIERTEEEIELQRYRMPCAPVEERVGSFNVVELGYS